MATTNAAGFAAAKINLFLHVLGRREDGYHDLDSLVVFANVGDQLEARLNGKWSLSIDGPFGQALNAEQDENLVVRAAKAVGAEPHAFHLEKNLPLASGVGGGSADAAAAIRLCGEATEQCFTDALKIGADVPACLGRAPVWMRGIGEKLSAAMIPSSLFLVLANAGSPVSTAKVFEQQTPQIKRRDVTSPTPALSSFAELVVFLGRCENDLEARASALLPEIGLVLAAIGGTDDCRLARMSGSGGTCFGLYETAAQAQAAAGAIKSAHEDWWVVATKTIAPDPNDQWVRLIQNSTMS